MTNWIDVIDGTLDRTERPVTFFFRDDDAGMDDPGLRHLLDVFETYEVPLDVAVIPRVIGAGMAGELRDRQRRRPAHLGLHQHGWSHVNHESEGRKHEFGPGRSLSQQQEDIARGMALLAELFPSAVDPVFTPPWNRCTQDTADALNTLGFRILSQDSSAAPLRRGNLVPVPVNVDWSGLWTFGGGPDSVGEQIVTRILAGAPVGIMLHHESMDAGQRFELASLLERLARHPIAELRLLRDVAGALARHPGNLSEAVCA